MIHLPTPPAPPARPHIALALLAILGACASGPPRLDMPDRGDSIAVNAAAGALASPAPARAAAFWAEVLWLEVREVDGVAEVVGNQPDAAAVLRFRAGTLDDDSAPITLQVGDLDLVRAGLASRRWPFNDGDELRFVDPDGRDAIVSRRADG